MLETPVLLVAAALGAAQPEASHPSDVLDGMKPLGTEALAQARGGLSWGGMQISLGADMRTYVNGQLALHTLALSPKACSQLTKLAQDLKLQPVYAVREGNTCRRRLWHFRQRRR